MKYGPGKCDDDALKLVLSDPIKYFIANLNSSKCQRNEDQNGFATMLFRYDEPSLHTGPFGGDGKNFKPRPCLFLSTCSSAGSVFYSMSQ